MEDKKAALILQGLLDKHKFDEQEKEAIKSAIGVLCWTCLASSRIKAQKVKLDRDNTRDIL